MDEQLDRSFQVCVVGDFNFPDIDWHSEKVLSGQTVDTQDSAREFLRFLNSKFRTSMLIGLQGIPIYWTCFVRTTLV